jgi:hypothetical protein
MRYELRATIVSEGSLAEHRDSCGVTDAGEGGAVPEYVPPVYDTYVELPSSLMGHPSLARANNHLWTWFSNQTGYGPRMYITLVNLFKRVDFCGVDFYVYDLVDDQMVPGTEYTAYFTEQGTLDTWQYPPRGVNPDLGFIQVDINSNLVNVGKTALALIFAEALRNYGITDIDVRCMEGDYLDKATKWPREAIDLALPKLRNTTLLINDVNAAPKEPKINR